MRRVLFLLSLSVLWCIPACVHAQNDDNVVDEVVWVVGDEPILKSDVEARRLEMMYNNEHIDGDPYCVIPEQIAVSKLFLHQAAIDSIEVSDGDVRPYVEQQINRFIQVIGSKEKLEEYFNKTITQIREQLFENAKDGEKEKQVRQKLVKDIKVTPAQVRYYFKDIPEDSVPFVPTKVEVQIITREPVIEQDEIDRVKDELRSFTERVNSGSDKFSTLALIYSQDPLSAQRGGELGFAGRGKYVPEFANVAFSLNDPNAVSKIVQTEFGFHIIQLIEKRGEEINCRHILLKPKVSTEALTNAVNDLDSIADELRRNLYTFDDCTQYISHDKDTRNNRGLMVNQNEESENWGTSKFELKELQPEIAKVVANMNIGEISKPFVMTNNKGKTVVAIVKLKEKVNGHRATMKDDYQVLQNVLLNKLYNEKVEQWIRDTQKTTYIRVDEKWNNCEFKYPGWIK